MRLGMSVPDAARDTGLSVRLIWARIAAGEIDARKVGRRTIVLEDSLREFLQRQPRARSGNPATHQAGCAVDGTTSLTR